MRKLTSRQRDAYEIMKGLYRKHELDVNLPAPIENYKPEVAFPYLIAAMLNSYGTLENIAKTLKTTKASLGYWTLKAGVEVRTVASYPGETFEIKQANPPKAYKVG